VQPLVAGALPLRRYQFERLGYLCDDPHTIAARSSSTALWP
jgi:hypothetical protein